MTIANASARQAYEGPPDYRVIGRHGVFPETTHDEIERINFLADRSPRAMGEAHGLMVNYLYKLGDIETNHEAFADKGEVIATPAIRRLVPPANTSRSLVAPGKAAPAGAIEAAPPAKEAREITA